MCPWLQKHPVTMLICSLHAQAVRCAHNAEHQTHNEVYLCSPEHNKTLHVTESALAPQRQANIYVLLNIMMMHTH